MNIASYELKAGAAVMQPASQTLDIQSPERSESVKNYISQGIPIHQIESYLDWLDAVEQTG